MNFIPAEVDFFESPGGCNAVFRLKSPESVQGLAIEAVIHDTRGDVLSFVRYGGHGHEIIYTANISLSLSRLLLTQDTMSVEAVYGSDVLHCQVLPLLRMTSSVAFTASEVEERGKTMASITEVNFGTPAERQRVKLANALVDIANHIRLGELEFEPRGFVMLLQSDQNPAQFEVLNMGIPTGTDMERAAIAIRSRIHKKIE